MWRVIERSEKAVAAVAVGAAVVAAAVVGPGAVLPGPAAARAVPKAGRTASAASVSAASVSAASVSASGSQITTAVAQGSSLAMSSGGSHYLFVGGSSAGSVIKDTTFAHVQDLSRCHVRPYASQGPIGPSHRATATGSFTSTGPLSVLAGVALSGYAVQNVAIHSGDTGWCGYSSGSTVMSGVSFAGQKAGGQVLLLVGTKGIVDLDASLSNDDHKKCVTESGGQLTALIDTSVEDSDNDGATAAVYSATVAPHSKCFLAVRGTSLDQPGTGLGMWSDAYKISASNDSAGAPRTRSSTTG